MGGDFGRYVIGTNTGSSNWLPLRLEEPTWQSSDSRMRALLPRLSEASQESWAQYIEAESEFTIARFTFGMKVVGIDIGEDDEVDCRKQERYSGDDKSTALAESKAALEAALVEFLGTLTPDQKMEVDSILEHRKESGNESAPSFDLNLIQRYVLKRVFDLGWTVDRFGDFDRYETRSYTRDASKAERVGKKYQWIAYHEIVAYIAITISTETATETTRTNSTRDLGRNTSVTSIHRLLCRSRVVMSGSATKGVGGLVSPMWLGGGEFVT